jgi:hypothetical protein
MLHVAYLPRRCLSRRSDLPQTTVCARSLTRSLPADSGLPDSHASPLLRFHRPTLARSRRKSYADKRQCHSFLTRMALPLVRQGVTSRRGGQRRGSLGQLMSRVRRTIRMRFPEVRPIGAHRQGSRMDGFLSSSTHPCFRSRAVKARTPVGIAVGPGPSLAYDVRPIHEAFLGTRVALRPRRASCHFTILTVPCHVALV